MIDDFWGGLFKLRSPGLTTEKRDRGDLLIGRDVISILLNGGSNSLPKAAWEALCRSRIVGSNKSAKK